MGRESYLARTVLGRSAFSDPLRDLDGNFVVGGQAGAFDSKTYLQQWNDRGRPRNPETERLENRFCRAQNEVLAACGVIVRKSNDNKRKQQRAQVPETAQLDILEEENNYGFLVKCVDRLVGYLSTWWLTALRRRLMTFGGQESFVGLTMAYSLSIKPSSIFIWGFTSGIISATSKMIRRDEITEPVACLDYLELCPELNLDQDTPSWRERLEEWSEYAMTLVFELPFELIATLQSLGFAVWPPLWSTLHGLFSDKWPFTIQSTTILARSMLLYFTCEYLHRQIGWRIYGLVRQISIRPNRATKLSIQAAERDDFHEEMSIAGIGRRLTSELDHRFYGPQDFWTALPVAFPWLSLIIRDRIDKEELKNETLERCLMLENESGMLDSSPLAVRERSAQNILNTLSGLGVDTEEDFYVDIDQWTRELHLLKAESPARHPAAEAYDTAEIHALVMQAEEAGTELHEGLDDSGYSERDAAANHEPAVLVNGVDEAAAQAFEATSGNSTRPVTPEQGIQRATSLSQITPRPRRRPTETENPQFEEMEALLAEARREHMQRKKKKKKSKDQREFRVTRLTTHAADSFAWHASAIITRIVLLPIDAIYWRSLARWFVAVARSGGTLLPLAVNEWTGGSIGGWPFYRMILLSFGLECIVRGLCWRLSSQAALYYGPRFGWRRF